MPFLLIGPFAVTLQRSKVIDYSESVFMDDLTALVPFKMSKDNSILIRTFQWEVWICLLIVTPVYIITSGIVEQVYTQDIKWWKLIDFTWRSLCNGSGVKVAISQKQIHKRIFSAFWMYSSFILFTTYSGL